MIHIDLFSGLGLFSYAADHVWSLEHIFCEIEDWPYRFLKQEYPNARIERDIKTFNGTEYAGRTFLLTASFPCQPISVAGKRLGTKDDRWLWPQTIAITRRVQPEWVIFENVAGLTSMAEQYSPSKMENKTVQRLTESDLYEKIFSQQEILSLGIIIDDIEKAGFELPKLIDGTPVVLCVPACAIGAVHRRDRIWIVAYRECVGWKAGAGEGIQSEKQKSERSESNDGNTERYSSNAQNSQQSRTRSQEREINNKGWGTGEGGRKGLRQRNGTVGTGRITPTNSNASNPESRKAHTTESGGLYTELSGKSGDVANSNRFNGNNAGHGSGEVCGELRKEAEIQGCENAANAMRSRQSRSGEHRTSSDSKKNENREINRTFDDDQFQRPWPEVATELCRIFISPTDWIYTTGGLDANRFAKITGQNMPYLWHYIQQKELWSQSGKKESILTKENLFAVLWQYFNQSQRQNNLSLESAEAQKAFLRNVWLGQKFGCSPQGWKYQEESAEKHSNLMPLLSHEVALETRKFFSTHQKDRVHRLKALGNTIQWEVALQIMQAIKKQE